MSRASRAGYVLIGAAVGVGLVLAALPLWGDALVRLLARRDPYADTYYVVMHFDPAWLALSLCLAAGGALVVAGCRRG